MLIRALWRIAGKNQSRLRSDTLHDLAHDARISDFCVVGQEEGFTDDGGKGAVALERQSHGKILGIVSLQHDAEILVIGLHQNVAAGQMYFVSPPTALDAQEPLFKLT